MGLTRINHQPVITPWDTGWQCSLSTAQCASSDDIHLFLPTKRESLVNHFGPMLVPVKPKAESVNDQLLKKIGVHVIDASGRPLGGVVPNRQTNPTPVFPATQCAASSRDCVGMYRSLRIPPCANNL